MWKSTVSALTAAIFIRGREGERGEGAEDGGCVAAGAQTKSNCVSNYSAYPGVAGFWANK